MGAGNESLNTGFNLRPCTKVMGIGLNYNSIWGGAYQRQQQSEQILPPLELLVGKVEAMGSDGALQEIHKSVKEIKKLVVVVSK